MNLIQLPNQTLSTSLHFLANEADNSSKACVVGGVDSELLVSGVPVEVVGSVLGAVASATPNAARDAEDADRSATADSVLVVGVELLGGAGT